jgi:hypothetical protein
LASRGYFDDMETLIEGSSLICGLLLLIAA